MGKLKPCQLTAIYNHPDAGYRPIEELEVGKEYCVVDVCMGQSNTSIFLEGLSGGFNSVNFDFFKDGNPHNIYKDPNYNPYIRKAYIAEIDFDYAAEDI